MAPDIHTIITFNVIRLAPLAGAYRPDSPRGRRPTITQEELATRIGMARETLWGRLHHRSAWHVSDLEAIANFITISRMTDPAAGLTYPAHLLYLPPTNYWPADYLYCMNSTIQKAKYSLPGTSGIPPARDADVLDWISKITPASVSAYVSAAVSASVSGSGPDYVW